MEICQIKNLSFAYPKQEENTLKNICFSVSSGEFITLCGKSGCGKTTLLRLLKSCLAPFGSLSGEILFEGNPLRELDAKTQAGKIGFVLQNPEQQIVTDKVWHELAFGLESLGLTNSEIRTRVSETASFFGIQNWFYQKTNELSGGQKQLLNLASVMVMQPEILILDEPTSLLDPIAASEFLTTLKKINEELGVTVLLSEHRLEEVFALSDRVIVMDKGEIIANDTPRKVGTILKKQNHDMYQALPIPMRVFGALEAETEAPLTIREGKERLAEYAKTHSLDGSLISDEEKVPSEKPVIEAKDVFFRYGKDLPNVIKDFRLTVYQGEFFALLGGNGTGKSTALSLLAGLNRPQQGKIFIRGKALSDFENLYSELLGVLPQNPQTLFAEKTVFLNLLKACDAALSNQAREEEARKAASLCDIDTLFNRHPYDLSGGEQQRAALAMILLRKPKILILDEPTKGMDAHFKKHFAKILKQLTAEGVTVLMVSHDIEFCAEYADRCALFFDGSITSCGTPRRFFAGNRYYTTSANRMAGKLLPNAVLTKDILAAAGKEPPKEHTLSPNKPKLSDEARQTESAKKNTPKTKSKKRIAAGFAFSFCCIVSCILQICFAVPYSKIYYISEFVSILFASFALACILAKRKPKQQERPAPAKSEKRNKQSPLSVLFLLITVPITVWLGMSFFDDRKYYFISLLILAETMLSFGRSFEKRKPQARELVLISALCALAVAGRAAFFMLPQFKPVAALVIISAVCFGGETGFLVGSVTAFVSNFFFGQGPWTPWQMFAFGIIGLFAGAFFRKNTYGKTKLPLIAFGFLATLILYGGIMNLSTVFMMTKEPTRDMIISTFLMGLPVDLIHASSTAFFLWCLAEPMTEKLERIKTKYGILSS